MGQVRLTLFVTDETPACVRAIQTLERIARDIEGNAFNLEVVDIVEEPKRAEQARILATPTLVKESPPPSRRLVGDLSDRDALLQLLGLEEGREGGRT